MSFANESTASWFNSYLTDRYHAAKYCDAVFDKRKLLSCVPQGSILGRILFVIYIKSLLDAIVPGPAIAYTDDITLISPGSSPAQAALNAIATLSMIRDCSRDNGLFLNPAMCSNMLITPWRTQSANPAAELILDHSDSRIKSVSELRILGVTLTVDFKWSVYARNTCRSITKMVVVLNRFGCSPNIDSRCHNFNASIRPKMIYYLPVWCYVNESAENAADHMLCCVAGMILHTKHAALDRDTFRITGILPFTLMSSLK